MVTVMFGKPWARRPAARVVSPDPEPPQMAGSIDPAGSRYTLHYAHLGNEVTSKVRSRSKE